MEEFFDVLNSQGEFTGEVASRKECHEKGLWHRAVYAFIFDKEGHVLLQKRSKQKKMWPGLWDVPTGGHVLTGEFGIDALIRETKEELGIDVKKSEIEYIVGSTSDQVVNGFTNRHFNECYIITKDIDISKIQLQEDEVEDIRWFDYEDVVKMIDAGFDGITNKTGPWNFLKIYCQRKFNKNK